MFIQYKNLTLRNATIQDAKLLSSWWNDGAVMAHAGFPNGTGQTVSEIAERIQKDTNDNRRLIIERSHKPIGEMNYRTCSNQENAKIAEIGIKICVFSEQEKGYGKIVLSMLISFLFHDLEYQKIILDTNLNNKRAQHVYEELGFKKLQVHINSWKNQLGELQSSVDYELIPEDFVNFTK